MMTQRMRSGVTSNDALMAGNAMFTTESSETRAAPAAAIARVTAAIMAYGVARSPPSTVQTRDGSRHHARAHVDGHAGPGRRRLGGRHHGRDAPSRRHARQHVRAREGRAERLMPIQINKAVIGKEYPPYAVTVERGKIKEFA